MPPSEIILIALAAFVAWRAQAGARRGRMAAPGLATDTIFWRNSGEIAHRWRAPAGVATAIGIVLIAYACELVASALYMSAGSRRDAAMSLAFTLRPWLGMLGGGGIGWIVSRGLVGPSAMLGACIGVLLVLAGLSAMTVVPLMLTFGLATALRLVIPALLVTLLVRAGLARKWPMFWTVIASSGATWQTVTTLMREVDATSDFGREALLTGLGVAVLFVTVGAWLARGVLRDEISPAAEHVSLRSDTSLRTLLWGVLLLGFLSSMVFYQFNVVIRAEVATGAGGLAALQFYGYRQWARSLGVLAGAVLIRSTGVAWRTFLATIGLGVLMLALVMTRTAGGGQGMMLLLAGTALLAAWEVPVLFAVARRWNAVLPLVACGCAETLGGVGGGYLPPADGRDALTMAVAVAAGAGALFLLNKWRLTLPQGG